MQLSAEEARVLACLIEKETTVPDSYPLTLNALRLGCNQTSNRAPVVAYEDRTVEAALLALKSIGLVGFVHPSHGGRTIRYRHRAGERWRLERNELAVLSVLVLRGPQTASEVRARVERQVESGGATVDDALDSLAARHPDAFAVRLERRPGERESRWAHLLSGEVDESSITPETPEQGDAADDGEPSAAHHRAAVNQELVAEVAALRRRLDRLEELLGVEPLDESIDEAIDEPVRESAAGADPYDPGVLDDSGSTEV